MLRDWNFFTFSPLAPLLLPAGLAAGEEEDEDAAVAAKVTDMIHPSHREGTGNGAEDDEEAGSGREKRDVRDRGSIGKLRTPVSGVAKRSRFRGQGTVGAAENTSGKQDRRGNFTGNCTNH